MEKLAGRVSGIEVMREISARLDSRQT